MKNHISRIVISGVLGLGLTVSASAQTAAPVTSGQVGPSPSARTPASKTRVLVLRSERSLSGDIERIGDRYRVKRVIGETWIPADQVHKLCDSLDDAYQFLRARANLQDPDEHLRLSQWCRQHNLHEQAIQETRAAAQLRPDDERIRRMLSYLESKRNSKPKPTKPVEPPIPPLDVSADAVAQFAVKVQPILMNACVRCHNSGRGGSFQLKHVSSEGMTDRRTMEKNLTAVMAEINPREPTRSRLLIKAVSIHGRGMGRAPLPGRDAVAFRAIENWVARTVASNPHLIERTGSSTASRERAVKASEDRGPFASATATTTEKTPWGSDRSPEQPEKVTPKVAPKPTGAAVPTPTVPPLPVRSTTAQPAPPPVAPGPSAQATTEPDPVDPDEFNRGYRPASTEPIPLPMPKRPVRGDQ